MRKKAIVIFVLLVAGLLYAGSVSATSNLFSLGAPSGVRGKPTPAYSALDHSILLHRGSGGASFAFRGDLPISSLAIIDMRGVTVCMIHTNRTTSVFWNGRNSRGIGSTSGLYIALINGRYAQPFVYSSKERGE